MAGCILFTIFRFRYLFLSSSRRLKVSGQAQRAVATTNDTAPERLYRKSHSGSDPPRKTESL